MSAAISAEEFGAFMRGDPSARESFPRRVASALAHELRRVSVGLSDDQRAEVLNELWSLALQGRGHRYDQSRGSVATFLKALLRDAARRVRASYAPPGTRSRDRNRRDVLELSPLNVVDRRGEARAELRLVERELGRSVIHSLAAIHLFGEPIADVAAARGMSRFALRRELAAARARLSA